MTSKRNMPMNYHKIFILSLFLSLGPGMVMGAENCVSDAPLFELMSKIKGCSAANSEDDILTAIGGDEASVVSFCESCKGLSPNEKGDWVPSSEKTLNQEYKKTFARSIMGELRKNLAGHLKRLMTLRTTTLEFDATTAIADCNVSSIATHTCEGDRKNTVGKILKEVLGDEDSIQSIQREVAHEIYNMANNDPKMPALFPREPNTCGISDKEFLLGRVKTWEDSFSLDIVEKIKEKFDSKELIWDDSKDVSSLITSSTIGRANVQKFKSALKHPLIAQIFSKKSSFEGYFKNLKLTGSSEEKQNKILDSLYQKQLSGEAISKISGSCKESFAKIKKTLCSDDFKKGNVNFSQPETADLALNKFPFRNENKQKNIELYCHGALKKQLNPITLGEINQITSAHLETNLKAETFQVMATENFQASIARPKEKICESINSGACSEDDESCKILAFSKNAKISGSPEEKLLSKHNSNIDKILGAFVGKSPTDDKKAKSYLIAQGIIPDDNGKIAQASEDQKPQSPSSFAAAQKEFAAQNPKYSYTAPSKNSGAQTTLPPSAQNNPIGFNPKSTTGNVGSKMDQNHRPDDTHHLFQNDGLIDTKNGILNRLSKQIGSSPRVAKDIANVTETTLRQPSKKGSDRGVYRTGETTPTTNSDPVNTNFIPKENRSKLTEGPKKKDEFNEAKQMMGQNRQPAIDAGVATGGQSSSSSSSPNSPVVSVATNGDNVITLDTASKDLEVNELVKQLKEKINTEQLQVILESDKKIKVLVNGKEIILTPISTGYLADCKESSLKKYLEAITAFFTEQLKDVARAEDLNKVFK